MYRLWWPPYSQYMVAHVKLPRRCSLEASTGRKKKSTASGSRRWDRLHVLHAARHNVWSSEYVGAMTARRSAGSPVDCRNGSTLHLSLEQWQRSGFTSDIFFRGSIRPWPCSIFHVTHIFSEDLLHTGHRNNGSLYLSVTPKFYTEVLHQTLNPTAELWCKTLSRIMFGVKPRF